MNNSIDINKAASDARAEKLEAWVKLHYKSQQEFIDKFELNQGEISNIIKKKRVIGERKARKLESQTDMPTMYLDGAVLDQTEYKQVPSDSNDINALLGKSPRSQALELLVKTLDELEQKQILTENEIKLLQHTTDVLSKSKTNT